LVTTPVGAYYPYGTLVSFGAVLRARLLWERYVSQALRRPYPPNPSPPVNVYKLLFFQSSTIGVMCEVASPYLVRYVWHVGICRLGILPVRTVRYGTVRYGTVCHTVRYGTVRYCTVRYG